MAADCSSCPVGSCSTAVTGVRLCQLGPLLLCRRELVSLPSLSVPLSNFRGLPVTLSDQLWNITAELREELWARQGILAAVCLQRTFSQIFN